MANDELFTSVTELYNRLLPAIRCRLDELKANKINDINELDIWEYALNNIWKNKVDLRIHEMANDILFIDEIVLIKYIKGKR